MLAFLVSRIIQGLITLFVISVAVFLMGRTTGSPADLMLPADARQEDFDALEKRLGLDRPLLVQYSLFLKDGITNGFGTSVSDPSRSAIEVVGSRSKQTAFLASVALTLTALAFVPLGLAAALTRGSWLDIVIRAFITVAQASPTFLFAIIAIRMVSVEWGILPTSGYGTKQVILPAATLSLSALPGLVRLLRSSMIVSLQSDYVRFAHLKGVPQRVVIAKHALRNAMIAPVTYFGTLSAVFLTGTVVTETIFAWPGLGSLAVSAVKSRDFPVVQSLVLVFATIFIIVQFLVDVTYSLLDPRIRQWGEL